MAGTWPRRFATFLVCLSAALQIAAIFSPGWLTDVRANVDSYSSVFYIQNCKTLIETECETRSYMDIYADARLVKQRAGIGGIALVELDYDYHKTVLQQVLVIVSLAVTLLLLVIQLWRSCHVDKRVHRLIAWSAVIGTIPTGLMISVVCQQLVYTSYMIDLRSFDSDRDHTYIGFPYSIAMYIGAITFLFLNVVAITYQSAGPAKERPLPKKRPVYDDEYDDHKPTVQVEFIPVEETPRIESPVDKMKPPGEKNNAVYYTEKL